MIVPLMIRIATSASPVRQLKRDRIIQLIYKNRSFASFIFLNYIHLDPSVAIVILNWNGRRYLEQFLPSVTAGIYSKQTIVVVDNASTDDSVAFVRSSYPQVQILQHAMNH